MNMQSWTGSIELNAPRERVFEYLAVPENLIKFWPGIENVHDKEKAPDGGTRFRWSVKQPDGSVLKGTARDVEFVPGRRIVTLGEGDAYGKVSCSLDGEGDSTSVSMALEYQSAPGIDPAFVENSMRSALANLKSAVEGR